MAPTAKVGDLGDVPVIPIILISGGLYLAWFGVHYWRRDLRWPSDPIKSVLRGKGIPPPGSITTSADILTAIQSETPSGDAGASNSSIVEAVRPYATVGHSSHAYIYGGAPGHDGKSPWDCSSFANWILSVKLGAAIPGMKPGQYDGADHGPTTLSYLAWTGATTVSHTASDAQPGDLCVWQTHMGFALGNGQMVSALNPALGTQQTSISETVTGEVLYVRRINGATGKIKAQPSPPSSGGNPTGGSPTGGNPPSGESGYGGPGWYAYGTSSSGKHMGPLYLSSFAQYKSSVASLVIFKAGPFGSEKECIAWIKKNGTLGFNG